MNQIHNTLGFDQSYTSSGYCIVDQNRNIIDFGTFRTEKTLDIYDRVILIAKFITKLVIDHNVKQINIEGLAFGIRGDATRDLAGLLFVIITTLKMLDPELKIEIIAPTSLKKFATGSGKADKHQMMESVPEPILTRFKDKNYKKSTGLTDVVDAYWLSQITIN